MMTKCCVKDKECVHANIYGVCKLSSNYDCKPVDDTEYIDWKKSLLLLETKEPEEENN